MSWTAISVQVHSTWWLSYSDELVSLSRRDALATILIGVSNQPVDQFARAAQRDVVATVDLVGLDIKALARTASCSPTCFRRPRAATRTSLNAQLS